MARDPSKDSFLAARIRASRVSAPETPAILRPSDDERDSWGISEFRGHSAGFRVPHRGCDEAFSTGAAALAFRLNSCRNAFAARSVATVIVTAGKAAT